MGRGTPMGGLEGLSGIPRKGPAVRPKSVCRNDGDRSRGGGTKGSRHPPRTIRTPAEKKKAPYKKTWNNVGGERSAFSKA